MDHFNKSPTTSPKLTSPSTPDEISIFDNAMLTSQKQQPSIAPIPVTPKTPTYKAKEVSRKHVFGWHIPAGRNYFFRKKLDDKQRIIKTLLQQILENVSPSREPSIK